MEGSNVILAVATLVTIAVVLSRKLMPFLLVTKKAANLNLPPGPWRLPVIGNLHHLGTSPLLFRTLRGLARKHGPLMMVHLGEVPALVVSSAEVARAVMKTHDAAFASRFTNATLHTVTYGGTDLVFTPYGDRWRQLRKMLVLEMLTAARVQSFRRVREEEVARFLRGVAAAGGDGAGAVDLSGMISKLGNDTFVRECVGNRCAYRDEYLDAFHTALRLTSGMTLADLFPSSPIMRLLGSAPRRVLACRHRMHRVLERVIQEKKEAVERGEEDKQAVHDTFIGVLLRLQKEGTMPDLLTDDTIIRLMFDLFAAGSDTSSTTLNWTMTELIRSPAAMAAAQAEVREAFQGKTTITEDDIAGARLAYLKLVIKEALRLHAPAPFLIPRLCREACRVAGYDIPEGTAVLVNAWAIGRDPEYWDDPEEFKPERFENSSLDYKGTNFEYLPFGAGRRMCPGINLGLANIELALVSLLYHFDWKLPDGMKPQDVDVWEAEGVIASKKTSLVLHPITRIAPANV